MFNYYYRNWFVFCILLVLLALVWVRSTRGDFTREQKLACFEEVVARKIDDGLVPEAYNHLHTWNKWVDVGAKFKDECLRIFDIEIQNRGKTIESRNRNELGTFALHALDSACRTANIRMRALFLNKPSYLDGLKRILNEGKTLDFLAFSNEIWTKASDEQKTLMEEQNDEEMESYVLLTHSLPIYLVSRIDLV